MVKGLERKVRLGSVGATAAYLAQIQAWAAAFRKRAAHVEAVADIHSRIELAHYELCLVVIAEGTISATELEALLGKLIAQSGSRPCLVLATHDDATLDDGALVDAALMAGASDFLVWETIDAPLLERAVCFALQRHRLLGGLMARETFLAAARERERLEVANSLHDGPLQDLIGTRFLLGALPDADSVAEIQDSLQSVIQDVRSLCSELKPPALGPFGLEKAIRAYVQGFQTRAPDIEIALELDVDDLQLPEWVRLALFRICQAALSNVDRHAQATHIRLRLRLADEQVHLTVADDGQGFNVPDSWLDFARDERCGLLMMQERVDALGGQLMVQSTSGSGTRVTVQVPLRQPPVPLPAFLSPQSPEDAASENAAPDRNG